MSALRQVESARSAAGDALTRADGRVRRGRGLPPTTAALLALQRAAGNEAVNALLLGQLKMPGAKARQEMADAQRELQRDEPAVDKVETGLKAAKALGVPVDLEGIRPPAAALAVRTTGFGPGNVPAKKPVPPPKKTPALSPLGKAGAKKAAGAKGPAGPAIPAMPALPGPAPAGGTGVGVAVDPYQPPAPPSFTRPDQDPAFTAVTGGVKATAKAKRAHAPAAAKAKEAQDAALPPTNDIGSQAKAAKADTMDAQRPGSFDKNAFITAVKAAIEAKTPTTLAQAEKYKESGKTAEVKGEVKGMVAEGKEGQARDITEATAAAPDQSKAVPKPVTPMGPEPPGSVPPLPAAGAAPKPASADQLNLAGGTHQANDELAQAEVSEQQLAESNEPQFTGALADKKEAAAHAQAAPAAYRAEESQVITQNKAEAQAATGAGMAGMQSSRGAALAKLVADKGKTKTKDEAERAAVTKDIENIFNATEADVKKILAGIDPEVDRVFNEGEAKARAAFESFVDAKVSAYKADRYGGWLGKLRWVRDKLRGVPDKVNEFYAAGRELYLKQMETTISNVANIVGAGLNAAKTRIADGKTKIAVYVKGLKPSLRKVGAEASKEIADRFDQLESDVDAKKDALVDDLATKYVDARKGLDERIEKLQEENKGLVDKAIGAIKGVINTIRELVAMLTGVLARVASVVGDIVKAPIRFLGNLIAGVKGGILKFKDDFLGHLRRGLMSWLFGALAEGGIELPKSFDLKGIVGFLASIFGLTWANIRNRIVKQIGEKAMGAVEKGVQIFQILSGPEGVGGLWNMLMEKLGDIKEMIFSAVKDFVLDRVITAGITWLIGLLNPAAAFIKACKLIYDIVMFFVNNAERIAKFVNTILDSVADIVRGNIGGVVNKINDVLGQMVPIIIGFLASVIGLGGIGAKVREIIQKLQKPVTKAVDFLIKTGLKLAGPIIRGLKGLGTKAKAKFKSGVAKIKAKVRGGDDSPEGKQKRLDLAMVAGQAAVNRFAGKKVASRLLLPTLRLISARYGLRSLTVVAQGQKWAVSGEINPRAMAMTDVLVFKDEAQAAVMFGRLASEVEREFFSTGLGGSGAAVVRSKTEQDFAASVARRGVPAMGSLDATPAPLEGVSSREQVSARMAARLAHARSTGAELPRNAVAGASHGEGLSTSEMLSPTRNQPHNAKLNEVGAYGLPAGLAKRGDVMHVIGMLRSNGMSDSQISRLMQKISREGRTPSVEMLIEHGYSGDASQEIRTGRSNLSPAQALAAVTQLTHVLEPLRFLERGFGLPQQPIATTTAMSHSIVQAGHATLDEVVSSNAPLGPATHLKLGDTPQLRPHTIAASRVRITMLVENVRQRWERWVLGTQTNIVEDLRVQGIAKPNLVPTKKFMMEMLTSFYGDEKRKQSS